MPIPMHLRRNFTPAQLRALCSEEREVAALSTSSGRGGGTVAGGVVNPVIGNPAMVAPNGNGVNVVRPLRRVR